MTSLFAQQSGPFYDPWESIEEPLRRRIARDKLKDILNYSRENSPFYQARLRDYTIDFESEHPLLKIPALTGDDLRQNLPPHGKDLITTNFGANPGANSESAGCSVFQSGGTTGMPKVSLFTHEELEVINACNARGFYATGLTPSDRVANLWAVGGLYMTFIHMNRMLQNYGCTSFPFSNHTPSDYIHKVSELFRINCFTGITSVVLKTLREIYEMDRGRDFRVQKIYFGGEHLYEADRKELQEKFGAQVIAAPGYGTVESWYLGYQCSESTNGVFHAFDDMVYLEILDEEAGPCELSSGSKESPIGMLYVTVFPRRLTPVIRLRVGDRARWLGGACPCGRQAPRFELLGRGDDILRIGYDSIDYAFVQKLVTRFEGLSGSIQMQKSRDEGRDRLTLKIETNLPKSLHGDISTKFEEAFLEERPSFREFVKKNSIWPLKLELVSEGTLPQNPRTGKLIRVIDCV